MDVLNSYPKQPLFSYINYIREEVEEMMSTFR
jgi:hypothetical protein